MGPATRSHAELLLLELGDGLSHAIISALLDLHLPLSFLSALGVMLLILFVLRGAFGLQPCLLAILLPVRRGYVRF